MLIQNQIKRVVAVHDLSCMGRVSLMAVVPILSSMGLEVCPLPTALLSCHTQYPEFTFLDLTDEMKRIVSNWKNQGFSFNAFYTGYLGSPEQVQIVEDLIPADVNVDGEVNISDINAVIDIIQDGDDGTPAADVNGDGEINIADINAVIHRILSDRSALGSAD